MKTTSSADALLQMGISPNVPDSNMEPANVVDALWAVACAIQAHAAALKEAAHIIGDVIRDSVS